MVTNFICAVVNCFFCVALVTHGPTEMDLFPHDISVGFMAAASFGHALLFMAGAVKEKNNPAE